LNRTHLSAEKEVTNRMNRHPHSISLVLAVTTVSLALLMPAAARADIVDDHIVGRATQLDDYLQQQMRAQHIPGLSVAVVHDGKLLLSRSYGLANVEVQAPTSPSTVYQIGSIAKQFTATAIMMLVEEGKVSLDGKISDYLPNLPATWSQVAVRHLLTHTSGIKDYINEDLDRFLKSARLDLSENQILQRVSSAPLNFPPGDQCAYSNTGYFLLGMIIERSSGKSYEAFMTERIFQPLGMSATGVRHLEAIIKNRATGYTLGPHNVLQNAERISPTQVLGAGSIVSTVEDLAKWDAALYTEVLLKRASLEQMWTPALLNNGRPAIAKRFSGGGNYGFGWAIVNYQKKNSYLYHPGSDLGFKTMVQRHLDNKVTVIVLPDCDQADNYGLAAGVYQIVTRNLPTLTP
jgi:D-alanyl-D-alanine carboxypeptidase